MMESDAWRCRRTDGKKWRCGMSVVPRQKYCDRHMHRGRLRSRKPVEVEPAVIATSASAAPPMTSRDLRYSAPTTTQNQKDARVVVVKRPAESSGVPASLTTDLCLLKPTAASASAESSNQNITSEGRTHNNNSSSSSVPQGLDFSPKTVLPLPLPADRCTAPCFHGVIITSEDEPRRCRRTDGKKWRCRRDVVSKHKYCDRHLHRGAKRRPQPCPALPSTVLPKPTPTIATHTAATPPITGDNVPSSSTSSDATISDGFIATSAN